MRVIAALLALLAAALVPAHADDLRPGYLEWREDAPGAWTVTWKAPLLGGLATRARPVLPPGCRAGERQRAFSGPAVIETVAIACDRPLGGATLGLVGLEHGFTDALLRVAPREGAVQAARLTPQAPTATVAARAGRLDIARTYLALGVEHIVFGFDHLLFVIALVLLVRGLRQLVATVTAFTLAHSLTLAATTLGAVALGRKPVEICIALSILLVARELLRPTEAPATLARRAPAAIAFVFGLLHGFGFAAALAEIGLPQGEVPLALLAFNVGVEAGQLVIVALALAALAALARVAPRHLRPATAVSAYAIGIVASAWLIERMVA